MTVPMYTDKEYLDEQFRYLNDRLDRLEAKMDRVEESVTGNRIELAKSGVLAGTMIALVEAMKQVARS